MFKRLFGAPPAPSGDTPTDGLAPEITPHEAHRLHGDGAVLVDVREPGEWRQGHARGAVHIPLGALAHRAAELPREATILCICASGNRSKAARDLLRRGGFARVTSVRGGTHQWASQQLPIERA